MNRRKLALSLTLALLVLSYTACSSSSSSGSSSQYAVNDGVALDSVSSSYNGFSTSSYKSESSTEDYYVDSDYSYDYDDTKDSKKEDTSADMTLTEEKLVYYCTTSIETKNFDESYSKIKDLISKYNGIIQSENKTDDDYNWYYTDRDYSSASLKTVIQCRVPSKNYQSFVDELSDLGENAKIKSQSTEIENISQEYYDNTTKIEALKIQEERLLQMMDQAQTIYEMITVEDRLTEVQYELNSLQTNLTYMDMDVAYSYVNLTLTEVKEYTVEVEETTFFSRMWDEIKDAARLGKEMFEDLLSFIFHLIPDKVKEILK
jgi:hypothetical protein